MSALDALNQLNKATVKTVKGEPKSKERPVMPVPPAVLVPFGRLVVAKNIAEVAEARVEVEQGLVNDAMMDSFCNSLFVNGCQPQNPRLKLEKNGRPDMEGLFQVQGRFVFNYPEGDDDVQTRIISGLISAGVPAVMATRLVTNEVDTTPITIIRPLNELVVGHYEGKTFIEATEKEKKVGEKIIGMVMGQTVEPLTDAERSMALVKKDNVKVKDGFLERVRGYVDTVDQLKAVFSVIKPVHFMSRMKFAVSDTPERYNERLVEEFGHLIGV